MKLICKKDFHDIKVNEIVTFIPRNSEPIDSNLIYKQPIGAILKIECPRFIYLNQLTEHFCSIKEYRKLKIQNLKYINYEKN